MAGSEAMHRWTLEDILLVPQVTEIALSSDGRLALYIVECPDIERGRPRATLRIVNIGSGSNRDIVKADIARSIKRISGTGDWSGLLDLGEGLQLYRIGASGTITPLMINPDTVPVGKADMSFAIGGGTPTHRVGVLAYDWSPDGQWLWYSLLKASPDTPRVRFDSEVVPLAGRRRSKIEAEVEVWLRDPDGQSALVMRRQSNDRAVLHAGANIVWQGDDIVFRVENPDGTAGSAFEMRAWDRKRGTMRSLAKEQNLMSLALLGGPRGGTLATIGVGDRRELVETLGDGTRHSYGEVAFTIGDSRSAGIARSADGQRMLLGTRSIAKPAYGLALVDAKHMREIRSPASLTSCGFDAALTFGVCVEQGAILPPRLVRVDLPSGK